MPGSHAHIDAIAYELFPDLGQNLGVALDGQFLLVDIDADDPEWLARLPATWTQRSPGGTHYVFRIPTGFRGWNHKIAVGTNGSTKVLGDLKVRGYFVAPGSTVDPDRGRPGGTYMLVSDVDPVLAPEWLLALAAAPAAAEYTQGGLERSRILVHENDSELVSLAGYWRRRGFDEAFIAAGLQAIAESGMMEQDPVRRQYNESDYRRIAKSMARKPAGEPDLLLALPSVRFGSETPIVGKPIEWWVHGLVPKGELVMFYGKGKVGKSSWASWLAAAVTNKGGRFMAVSPEEPFARFLARAIHNGAQRNAITAFDPASAIRLPNGLGTLKKAIELLGGVDVLYLDAVNAHFEAVKGQNTAERARACLTPLAEWAMQSGMTIIGTFHEGKGGEYLGSTEMVNVARHVLRARRKRGGPMHLDVDLTNLYDPEATAVFTSTLVDFVDPATGEVQREEAPDGTLRTARLRVAERIADIVKDASLETAPGESINVDEITEPKNKWTTKLPGE